MDKHGSRTPELMDYLAEAFRVWDCEEQRWANPSPILLRFENEDVLIWKEDDKVVMQAGPVSTQDPPCGIPALEQEGRRNCTCWLHDGEYDACIGGLWSVDGLASLSTSL